MSGQHTKYNIFWNKLFGLQKCYKNGHGSKHTGLMILAWYLQMDLKQALYVIVKKIMMRQIHNKINTPAKSSPISKLSPQNPDRCRNIIKRNSRKDYVLSFKWDNKLKSSEVDIKYSMMLMQGIIRGVLRSLIFNHSMDIILLLCHWLIVEIYDVPWP